jgi:hypothetical protein
MGTNPDGTNWLSITNYQPTDKVRNDMFNSLALDLRSWGGNVNGGGYQLSNVILSGTGGFQYTASPITLTPGADNSSQLALMQTTAAGPPAVYSQRWAVEKNATAEGGSNSGSDFAIVRYSDSGAVLGTPFSIQRSSGLITMNGAQQWNAAVNGGGQTLNNVVIAGYVADPTTTKGDILARSSSAVTRVAVAATDGWVLTASSAAPAGVAWAAPAATGVPTTRQILTPAGFGLTGGGALSADLTLKGVVMAASGASHAMGMAPDPGATTGATRYLREDATWAIPAGAGGGMTDPTNTLGDLIVNNGSGTTRIGTGGSASNGFVLTADSTVAGFGIKWAAPPATGGFWQGGSGGAIYYNGGNVGIGTTTPVAPLHCYRSVSGGAAAIVIDNDASGIGTAQALQFRDGTYGILGGIYHQQYANWHLRFTVWSNTTETERMTIDGGTGNVGIGTTSPRSTLTASMPGTNAALPALGSASGANLTVLADNNYGIVAGTVANGNAYIQAQRVDAQAVAYALMLQPLGGNVGIGTTSPAQSLSVVGSGSYVPTSTAGMAGSAVVTSGPFGGGVGMIDGSYTMGMWSNGGVWNFGNGTTSGALTSRLVINTSGNVGIGTANPQFLAHLVNPNAGTLATMPSLVIGVDYNPIYNLWFGYGNPGTGTDAGAIQAIQNNVGAQLLLNPIGGNVGIGTTNPTSPLDVNGSIHLRYVAPGAGIWLDASDYTQVAFLGMDTTSRNWRFYSALSSGNVIEVNLTTGNVGIGQLTPAYKCDIAGDCNVTGAYRVNGTAISTGGVTTQTSPSRALGTVYQNTTGKPMLVTATVQASSGFGFTAKCDGSNPPGTTVGIGSIGGSGLTAYIPASFWVLPGYYYEITGSGPIVNWLEWY